MERLLSVAEIRERYHCNDRTARARMKEMGALQVRPMMVAESAVAAWEAENTGKKESKEERRQTTRRSRIRDIFPVEPVPPKPGQLISRVRPKKGA